QQSACPESWWESRDTITIGEPPGRQRPPPRTDRNSRATAPPTRRWPRAVEPRATVQFNDPLSASSANNSSLYHVFAGVKKVVKRHKQIVFAKSLAIKPVSAHGNTVTITLAKPFGGTVRATVQGTITGANGASINVRFAKTL